MQICLHTGMDIYEIMKCPILVSVDEGYEKKAWEILISKDKLVHLNVHWRLMFPPNHSNAWNHKQTIYPPCSLIQHNTGIMVCAYRNIGYLFSRSQQILFSSFSVHIKILLSFQPVLLQFHK